MEHIYIYIHTSARKSNPKFHDKLRGGRRLPVLQCRGAEGMVESHRKGLCSLMLALLCVWVGFSVGVGGFRVQALEDHGVYSLLG